MAELIFFAVIILFSILESVARQRKKERAEDGEGDDEVRAEVPRDRNLDGADRQTSEEPSETMIPADIWEEIAGLAPGEREPEPEPDAEPPTAPRPAEPKPASESARPAPRPVPAPQPEPSRSPMPVADDDAHPVHRTHTVYGTDPSERAPSRQDWRPSGHENRNAKRVRAMLQGREGADALKQAVILQEVLGPPAAMKDGDERP
ncbi:MAG: hypothetical protein U5R14_09245 [Gemmatimonadota bacterium]|nr:hypothetical protein [Gemmatimonadota bacterium]